MAIKLQCPQCAKSYELPDEMAGKTAKCVCGAQIAIPASAAADPLAAPPAVDPLAAPPVADPLAAPPVADPLAAPMQAPDAPPVPQQMAPTAGPWAGGQQQQGPEPPAVPGESSLPSWLNAIIGKTIMIRIIRGVLMTIMFVLLVFLLMENSTKSNWNGAHDKLAAAGTMAKADVRKMMQDEFGAELKEGSRKDQFRFGGRLNKYWIELNYSTLRNLPEGTVVLERGEEVTVKAKFDESCLLQKNFGDEYPKIAAKQKVAIPEMPLGKDGNPATGLSPPPDPNTNP